jgi:hypothetical protein
MTKRLPVSQVMYHPVQPSIFVSGSLDGLINVADFSVSLDEDDSFKVHRPFLVLTGRFSGSSERFCEITAPLQCSNAPPFQCSNA